MALSYRWHYCRKTLHCQCIGGNCANFHPKLCCKDYQDSLRDEGVIESTGCVIFPKRASGISPTLEISDKYV